MADFTRIEDALGILGQSRELKLEDVLGLYLDLCQDIKGGGCAIEDLEIGDADELISHLCRMGRIYINIINKRADEVKAFDGDARIAKQSLRIVKSTEALSECEEEMQALGKQLHTKDEELSKAKKELIELKLKLGERTDEIGQIRDKCSELEITLRPLEAELDEQMARRDELYKAVSRIEDENRELRQWFESLEADKCRAHLERIDKQNKLFLKAQEELFAEMGQYELSQRMTRQTAQEKKAELSRKMAELEEMVSDYKRQYRAICELLSD